MGHAERRERIEHWVGDFLESSRFRDHAGLVREYAPDLLVAFLEAACAVRDVEPGDVEPGDVEAGDLESGLRAGVARIEIPSSVRPDVAPLCGDFLEELQAQGRLAGGRALGLAVRALAPRYLEAAAGKGTTYVAPAAKVGRNDPCPCGSGRKYKKCCLTR